MDVNKAHKIAQDASNLFIHDIYIIKRGNKHIVTDRPYQNKYELYTIVARYYNGVIFRPINPQNIIMERNK